MQPKTSLTKNYEQSICLKGVCYAPNCTPLLWVPCKLLLSVMQIVGNCVRCCITPMLSLPMLQSACHRPNSIFYETTKIATGVLSVTRKLSKMAPNVWKSIQKIKNNNIKVEFERPKHPLQTSF
jgi:hypothetical protein